MHSLIIRMGLAAAALCGLALAGCNAVEDVRDDPYTAIPASTVALNGTIYGLGSRRSVTLQNNGDANGARSFVASTPVKPLTSASETPFTFGAVAVGSAFNIEVKQQPYGKTCVVSGGAGTVTTQEALNITITCTNISTIPRYAVRVQVPPAFISSANAKVTLSTEEGVFEKSNLGASGGTIACGANTCVQFDAAVVSIPTLCTPATPTGVACAPATTTTQAPGVTLGYAQPVFPYVVTASTTEGGTVNKCQVTNPTNSTGTTGTIAAGVQLVPSADVTNVTVGLCAFTISGTVSYNLPFGVNTVPAMGAGGLTLELRDAQGKILPATPAVNIASYSTTGGANAFTLSTNAKSNATQGVLDVVITHHPDGQFCIVGNAAGVNLYVPGITTNPVNQTVSVSCRAKPDSTRQLKGTYRLTSQTYTPNTAAVPTVPVTVIWNPFSSTLQNIASSNLITFFDDGTFLYGSHAQTSLAGLAVQIEHGFYDFDRTNTANQKLRFSMVTDTNAGTTFNATFANTVNNTSYNGLSATPGPVTFTPTGGTALTYRVMTNVVLNTGNPRTLTGSFGPELTTATTKLDWVLSEPVSVPGEWTGTWISQDHRRFWVWDFNTYYGTHVGVNGGSANMQDACFTTETLHAATGLYTRRGSSTGCYPYNRPFPGSSYLFNGNEAIDSALGGTAGAVTAVTSLPGFVGRIPGGLTAFDGRSPSPLYFLVAPSTQFAGTAPLDIFPAPGGATAVPYTTEAFPAWCPAAEILGMRATLNDTPIDYPVYFCRQRVP